MSFSQSFIQYVIQSVFCSALHCMPCPLCGYSTHCMCWSLLQRTEEVGRHQHSSECTVRGVSGDDVRGGVCEVVRGVVCDNVRGAVCDGVEM